MSWWNKVSEATRVPKPVADAVKHGPAAAVNRPSWIAPYMFIAAAGFVLWAIWSGAALVAVRSFELQLIALVPAVAVTLVILAVLSVLVGWALMKAPGNHFLAVYGRRLVLVAIMAIPVGAAIMPVALSVVSMTEQQATQLTASYLGQRPAANLCQAAGLVEPTPAPR